MDDHDEFIVADDPPLGKKAELFVYIYNMTEDEWPFIESVTSRSKQNHLIADCENAADAFYLSTCTEVDSLYVSPKVISKEFQYYAKKLLHFRSANVLVPKNVSHLICDDLLKDGESFEWFIKLCRQYAKVILVSYAATPQFYSLQDALKREGVSFVSPEAP